MRAHREADGQAFLAGERTDMSRAILALFISEEIALSLASFLVFASRDKGESVFVVSEYLYIFGDGVRDGIVV